MNTKNLTEIKMVEEVTETRNQEVETTHQDITTHQEIITNLRLNSIRQLMTHFWLMKNLLGVPMFLDTRNSL